MLAAGGVASAQNSDLGVLLGVMVSSGGTSGLPQIHGSWDVGGAGQMNYAYQVRGWQAGDLYVELPFILAERDANEVSRGGFTYKEKYVGGVLPGIRFKLPLSGRASLYAAGGAGIGICKTDVIYASRGSSGTDNRTTINAAFDFGVGLDLRLTRLLSLRGEVRDLIIAPNSLSPSGGRNNPIFSFGFALHF